MITCVITNRIMITLFVEENNPLTPTFYNSFISKLQFHQLTCTCGLAGTLSIHGYYYRFIKAGSEKLCFRICRVVCAHCGKTHALLLSSMVPYSQLSLKDHLEVIDAFESHESTASLLKSNNTLDESTIRYVIRSYCRHWKQRILSLGISIFPSAELTRQCFSHYLRQFMQIKISPNYLFLNTT